MNLTDNPLYVEDITTIISAVSDIRQLRDKTLLVSGATGMIGKLLVDVIMYMNKHESLNCRIIALGRNEANAVKRFGGSFDDPLFTFVKCDINDSVDIPDTDIDYYIHAASNTHPVAYAEDPIGTIMTNILGTYNLLDSAVKHHAKRFVFLSTVEVYGENRGDAELFDENYCGFINCNTVRAGYPESKRAGEALCQSFRKKYGIEVVIPRLPRSFGPSMLMSDSKATAQFIKKALNKENIVLKSDGKQQYSFGYSADAVSGVLTCLFSGADGEAYNIADEKCNLTLGGFAELSAECAGTHVTYDVPDKKEAEGFSNSIKAMLDGTKLHELGWHAHFYGKDAISRRIKILGASEV